MFTQPCCRFNKINTALLYTLTATSCFLLITTINNCYENSYADHVMILNYGGAALVGAFASIGDRQTRCNGFFRRLC